MGKFRHFLTGLSARDTIIAGYYRYTFLFFIAFELIIPDITLSVLKFEQVSLPIFVVLLFVYLLVCGLCSVCLGFFALSLGVMGRL